MKSFQNYTARLEEHLLFALTSAAFYISLSHSTGKQHSGIFIHFARTLESHAQKISRMLSESKSPHLNPALFRMPSGNLHDDLNCALSGTLRAHTRLLLLAAYAPKASWRRNLIGMIRETRTIIDFLTSIIQ